MRHEREAGTWATWHVDPDAIRERAWPIGLDALPELQRREIRRQLPERVLANVGGVVLTSAFLYLIMVIVLAIGG